LTNGRIKIHENSLEDPGVINTKPDYISYVQPKWLTEPKFMLLSWPGPHIE